MTAASASRPSAGVDMTTPLPELSAGVHYVAFGTPGGEYASVCRAATITEVGAWVDAQINAPKGAASRTITQVYDQHACALHVANPTGQFFNVAARHELPDDGRAPAYPGGTWHSAEHCIRERR